MSKLEKLTTMYDYAIANHLCLNRKTFADLIGKNPTNLSSAFSDENSKNLTNNLLLHINKAIGAPFNVDWLLYDTMPMMVNQHTEIDNSNTTNIDVNMADDNSNNSGNLATNGSSIVVEDSQHLKLLLTEKDKQIEIMQKQIETLNKQVETLTGIITQLTTK